MRTTRRDRFLTGTAVAVLLPLTLMPPAVAQDAPKPVTSGAEAVASKSETAAPATEPSRSASLTIRQVEAAVTAGADIGAAWTRAALVDSLRELDSGKFDRMIGSRKDRESIDAFYRERDYAPLWIEAGALNARGKAAAGFLAGVAADGLEPADYPTPTINPAANANALAEAEIRLTSSVLEFAKHASGGRVHYTRVSGDIAFDLERPEPSAVLAKLAASGDVTATLDSFNPQAPGYKALKAALAKARSAPEEKLEIVQIAGGPMLRPGMRDSRVIDIRKRLGITGNPDSPVYDDTVIEAVKAFQREKGLGADGILGPNTLRAMNGKRGPSADPVDTILANMERWRWLPHDLGRIHVMVNIPDFTLRVVRDNKLVWSTKIVVGKPNLKTPLISASMKYITVNPTWNVPPSIIRNEYLPVIQQDPTALERYGLIMEENPDGTVRIYQPPGDRNALGRIRFNFPNRFLVYQHDTPDKHLFARDVRAYSHGCMRVQDPLKYGEVLLSLALPGQGYTQARLRSMYGPNEINISFPQPIPVHLTYQTAFVDDDGELQFRRDIYGLDASVLSWLQGSQRKIADIGIVRPKSESSLPVTMPPGLMAGPYYSRGGPSFFERLFGFDAAEPRYEPPPPRERYRRRHFSDGRPPGFF